jgi:hypothetical protein
MRAGGNLPDEPGASVLGGAAPFYDNYVCSDGTFLYYWFGLVWLIICDCIGSGKQNPLIYMILIGSARGNPRFIFFESVPLKWNS